MKTLVLAAPLAGWASRLDEVPDPAFAEGMVGDGVAIDPTSNELCAPCDGVIVSVHRAHHACTLRTEIGAELLLHIGIDTVELKGKGYQVLVADGQRVRTGEPLIRFDLDFLLGKAKSLHTPIVLLDGEGFAVIERTAGREVAVGDMLMSIARVDARGVVEAPAAPARNETVERHARVLEPHGLHARPAAAFAHRARQHAGDVTVVCRERSANGKSMVAVMALDARLGDDVTITVSGTAATATINELVALIGNAPSDAAAASTPTPAAPRPTPRFTAGEEAVLTGSPAAVGLAIGRVVRLADTTAMPEAARDGAGPAIEQAKLTRALGVLRLEIEQTIASAAARGDAAAGDIFRAHLELLDDPELAAGVSRELAAGRSAAWAWRAALQALAALLRGLGNPLLAERTGDLGDLERRTLALLAGGAAARVPAELPAGAVLVADEIFPSELTSIPAGRLAGLCTAGGGPTSHVAVLAAGMGIPAVVAIGDGALRIPDGAPVIVDGDRGEVRVFPAAATRDAATRAITTRTARRRTELAAATRPARTQDGSDIAVYANLGHVNDANGVLALGAEGCGLLRTELLFFDRQSAPSEDEQAAQYQAIANALQGRPLIIRTLDAGGDKPLAYLPQAHEDNPALGVRGVRLALRHPELMRTQIRAILRVQPAGICQIMVPMIASVAELRAVRAVVEQEQRALGVTAPIKLGTMIEVPTAALMAETLATTSDFFSIGTNDLTQYALAMDRGNRDVTAGLDCLHPGVLRLIASTVRGARTRDLSVSVCGGAAADPCAVPILLGLGVRTLSVAPAVIPEIKALVTTLSLARCTQIATQALDLESSEAVRTLVVRTWPDLLSQRDGWIGAQTWRQ